MYHNDASFIISILAEIYLRYYIFAVHRQSRDNERLTKSNKLLLARIS